jgi:hypothetical protein
MSAVVKFKNLKNMLLELLDDDLQTTDTET